MAGRVEASSSGSDSSRALLDNRMEHDDTEDISTLTLETDNRNCSTCMHTHTHTQSPSIGYAPLLMLFDTGRFAVSSTMPTLDADERQRTDDGPKENGRSSCKFAAITAALSDMLLDDETSPSDSLISSSASDDCALKQAKKKINDSIKECANDKDLNDTSPVFDVTSPISPRGTPTHATNSFSFSDGDGARDFLIDDEIADQPVLCFGDTHGN